MRIAKANKGYGVVSCGNDTNKFECYCDSFGIYCNKQGNKLCLVSKFDTPGELLNEDYITGGTFLFLEEPVLQRGK